MLLSLCVITAMGFLFWNYNGPFRIWFKYYATVSVYEVFWCLAVFFLWPMKKNALKIAVWVFIVSCVLEALQLWRPEFLQRIRATFLGAVIIGTSFVWWQIPHYILGGVIGFVLMRMLGRREACNKQGS